MFHYLTGDRIDRIPDLEPMIDGVLDKGIVAMLGADPGAGKSFLAVDWALSYATGKPWQGRSVDNTVTYPNDRPATGKALYVAAEGARGMKHRRNAWRTAWQQDIPDEQFILMPQPVQLGDPNEVEMLCADLAHETPGLVVIDTVARCARGLEENSARDMGLLIDSAYRIRNAMGPDGTVLLVHHHGKAGTLRGSSALHGGVDLLMSLNRDGTHLELTDEKRKDGPEMDPISLELTEVADSLVIQSGDNSTTRSNQLVDEMHSLGSLPPLSMAQLIKAVDLPESVTYKALSRAIADGTVIDVGNGNTPKYQLAHGGGL